jgi:hypothetical protein
MARDGQRSSEARMCGTHPLLVAELMVSSAISSLSQQADQRMAYLAVPIPRSAACGSLRDRRERGSCCRGLPVRVPVRALVTGALRQRGV